MLNKMGSTIFLGPRSRAFLKTIAAGVVAGIVVLIFPVTASAVDRYELRVHDNIVSGTHDLLNGRVDKSIERMEKSLATARSHSTLTPVLINLCAAYTMKRDFEMAEKRCDAAIEHGWSVKLAYNNRGVMNIARGDYRAAVLDFEAANGRRAPSSLVRRNMMTAMNHIAETDLSQRYAGVVDEVRAPINDPSVESR